MNPLNSNQLNVILHQYNAINTAEQATSSAKALANLQARGDAIELNFANYLLKNDTSGAFTGLTADQVVQLINQYPVAQADFESNIATIVSHQAALPDVNTVSSAIAQAPVSDEIKSEFINSYTQLTQSLQSFVNLVNSVPPPSDQALVSSLSNVKNISDSFLTIPHLGDLQFPFSIATMLFDFGFDPNVSNIPYNNITSDWNNILKYFANLNSTELTLVQNISTI